MIEGKSEKREYELILVGDMAIVDEYCHLEKKGGCQCANFQKLTMLKNRLKELRKKQKISLRFIYINIPGEESCQQKRRKIWDQFK